MEHFAKLFSQLDQTNKTNEKVEAIAEYFRRTDAASAAWGLYFLSGQKLQRVVSSGLLRQWAIEVARIEPWLFDECYEAVGDLGETISLVVPRRTEEDSMGLLASWVEQRLLPLRRLTVAEQRSVILASWRQLNQVACLVLNKLLTGSFRVGVSQKLVVRGLSVACGVPAEVLAHRLMGSWQPSASFFERLVHPDSGDTEVSRPYPFYLASPLEGEPHELGQVDQWQVEWKWDGIRAQVIRRQGQTYIWSRGEELMKDRFPELERAAECLPDGTVVDGEIVGRRDGVILPFAQMQRRIGRKQLGPKVLREVPVSYLMFDVLEVGGEDVRGRPLRERRVLLEALASELVVRSRRSGALELPGSLLGLAEGMGDGDLDGDVDSDLGSDLDGMGRGEGELGGEEQGAAVGGRVSSEASLGSVLSDIGELSPGLPFLLPARLVAGTWEELADVRSRSREAHAEGLMLKRLDSPYRVGRPRGDWWKWKIEPYTVDAVLIYAQRGHGKRASLYTDYTFGVWDGDVLVPFAKAYSGLTDKEIAKVDRYVRQHTLERFGPVRSVQPALVFELAFENIQISTRHKSGIAVRFPRILRWRSDKSITEADSLTTIRAMLTPPGQAL